MSEMSPLLPWIFTILGIFLLVAEVFMPGFFIAVPGTALLVIGIIGFIVPYIFNTIWTPVIGASVAVAAMIVSMYFYRTIGKPMKSPMATTTDSLIGKEGIVVKRVIPHTYSGKVKIDGEIWSATAEKEIEEGKKVRVIKASGVHVEVEEVEK